MRQEVRAVQRTHWTRWRQWLRGWVVQWVLLLPVVGVAFWFLHGSSGSLSTAVTVGLLVVSVLVVMALDLATMPWRVGRVVRRAVMLQSPPGTPVKGIFEENRIGFVTPDASHAVSTGVVERATWVENCLVLDTTTDKFYIVHGALLSDEAWQVVTKAFGPRLHTM